MNKYKIEIIAEFIVIADSENKALEIADDKLTAIPNNIFQITNTSISKGDEV